MGTSAIQFDDFSLDFVQKNPIRFNMRVMKSSVLPKKERVVVINGGERSAVTQNLERGA